jgi:hypothetical protein
MLKILGLFWVLPERPLTLWYDEDVRVDGQVRLKQAESKVGLKLSRRACSFSQKWGQKWAFVFVAKRDRP